MNNYGNYGTGNGNMAEWFRQFVRTLSRSAAGKLVKLGVVLAIIGILIFLFPRVVGWLIGTMFLVAAFWMFRLAWRTWRMERRWRNARFYGMDDFYEVL